MLKILQTSVDLLVLNHSVKEQIQLPMKIYGCPNLATFVGVGES